MKFYPIQLTSSFSLLKSPIEIKKMIKQAKEFGYDTLALTDNDVMYGSVEFYDLCLKNDIKPIIGANLEIDDEDVNYRIVLIARTNQGYQNLIKISSLKMTLENLKASAITSLLDEIAVVLPSNDKLHELIASNKTNEIDAFLKVLKSNFLNLKLGLNCFSSNAEIKSLIDLSNKFELPIIADVPVKYLDSNDYFTTQVLNSIEESEKITNLGHYKKDGPAFLRRPAEVEKTYIESGLSEALNNLDTLKDQVDLKIVKQTPQLPKFDTPKGISSGKFLNELCNQGLDSLLEDSKLDTNTYKKRLEHELKIIHEMGFDDYFLIIWDVVNFSHENSIMTGPGRGSVAGSLVAYVLKITDVDPIKYDLLFERFLNPQRKQMPDIDLDIPDIKRETVIQYVHNKYGHERVAQIITFGTFAAKQAIRDVGRSFGLTTSQLSIWSKSIPNSLKITLDGAYQESQKLKNLVADSDFNQQLFTTAQKIEGLPRHYSTHAAGIVLSQNPIVNVVPVQNGNENLLLTQYSKDYVESLGLLKMDFLGLRNLTILDNILQDIKINTENGIDINHISLDDSKTLELFQTGDTNGIFQFESAGIKNVLRRLHPDSFDEVALVNALYRPGPMQNISELIERKYNKQFEYLDETLKNILLPTYGIIVYQEQVMLVAVEMAGFTLGEADILRRAMSKKKISEIEKIKADFTIGARKKGYNDQLIKQVFSYIEEFANYGFNKSHAIAYSKMAFELAYLKAHYPGEFFTELLNSVHGNADKIKIYLSEAKNRHIKIKNPDINKSSYQFTFSDSEIIFGFSEIKGIRRDFIKAIIDERQINGSFISFQNFLSRIPEKYLKSDLIVTLIYTGCFDEFGYNRATLVNSLTEYIEAIKLSGNSINLFKELQPKIKSVDEYSISELLEKESEYLGVYLSGHPVEKFEILRPSLGAKPLSEITEDSNKITVIVYVTNVKTIRTKTGQPMAFVKGSDLVSELDITVFSNVYKKVESWLKKDMVLVISGKIDNKRQLQLIAEQITPANNLLSDFNKRTNVHQLFLRINNSNDQSTLMEQLDSMSQKHHGDTQIIVWDQNKSQKWKLESKYNLNVDNFVIGTLKQLLGNQNVVYK